MGSRSFRYAVALLLIVLGVMAIRPYIEYRIYAATTPRPIEARGNLADYEKSAIDIFERVSPSVVYIVGRGGGNELPLSALDEAEIRTGTGFIWDQVGNVVTNDHVVEGAKALAKPSRQPLSVSLPTMISRSSVWPARASFRRRSRSEARRTSRSGRRPLPSATRSGSTSRSPAAS
jgi:hypothetical protein